MILRCAQIDRGASIKKGPLYSTLQMLMGNTSKRFITGVAVGIKLIKTTSQVDRFCFINRMVNNNKVFSFTTGFHQRNNINVGVTSSHRFVI